MNDVQRTWFRQARTEYTAASLVAEMTHWLIRLGVGPDLLVRATRVVSDEVRHATICRELYVHVGGDPGPVALNPRALAHADDPDAPTHLRAITAAGELACEESVALTVFRMRLENARDPMAREVCEVILRDEATHRVFAWDTLDALTALVGQEATRAWVRPRIAWWLRTYLGAKLRPVEPTFPPEDLAFGLIDRRAHWAAMRQTVEAQVLPRFQSRGLLEAEATPAMLIAELEALGGVPPGRSPPATA
ncbi:MAG: ferritin-like domain-containing protein [Myxococcales bacterium]|nr:ferritin-like domain-containing protein [Myxococcales bacterium]